MKKKISTDGTGSANINQYKAPKSKPKPYIRSTYPEYWLQRDRLIYAETKDPETKQAILERYGKV